MVGTWAGVEAKMRRARTHLADLQEILEPLIDGDRQEFTLERDAQTSKYLLIVRGVPRRDPLWALFAGDCLHNLRSALDYLAYGIALNYATEPPNENTQFPIHESPFGKKGGVRPLLVPEVTDPRVLDALKAVQPYEGPVPANPTISPLWQINKLCNIDKHRLMLTAVCALALDEMWWGLPQGMTATPELNLGPLKDGDPVARFDFGGQEPPDDFDAHPALQVAVHEDEVPVISGEPITRVLDIYIKSVGANVLPEFEGLDRLG
jgi:hypothetical protein